MQRFFNADKIKTNAYDNSIWKEEEENLTIK